MILANGRLPMKCRNYESILSATCLIPETSEDLSEDAGCDTCVHFMSGVCDILPADITMDSMDLTISAD
jgi:hypothetical protein